jgi:hypothetical protein
VIARTGLRTESRLAASPVWLRLVDTFTGRRPAGPVQVSLERRDGTAWLPMAVPHQLTEAGDLGFLDLARGRPGDTGSVDVRVGVTSPGTATVFATGDPVLEMTVPIWSEAAPPAPTAQVVSFVPGQDYRFGPGVPLLAGRVVDAAGAPLDRAAISVTETVRGSPVVEQAMTNADGWFRLPLRWSSGATQVSATRGALSGSATITVPDDLDTILTLTLT